jgi:transposase
MIPQGVQVFVALDPIDLRYSFDRLAGLAREQVGYDARSGALFVFFSRRKIAVKILFFDGSGLPEATESASRRVEIDDATLEALLDGVEVEPSVKRSVH